MAILSFQQAADFIREHPKEADGLAFEYQKFAKDHPETLPADLSESVRDGKAISEAYYFLREQHEDSQMSESGYSDTPSIPQDLVGLPLLALAFLTKPKTIQDDGDYQKIEERLKKEWLKKNNTEDFLSKEGLDYLHGSLDGQKTDTLAQNAEVAFRGDPKFKKRLERYDREQKRVYKKYEDDPAWQAHQQKAQTEINDRLEFLEKTRDKKIKTSSEDLKKSQEEIAGLVSKKSQEEFVRKHPEKAKAYFEKIGTQEKKSEQEKGPTKETERETLREMQADYVQQAKENPVAPAETTIVQETPPIAVNAPTTEGQSQQVPPQRQPSGGGISRGINNINNFARNGFPNPLGRVGQRIAAQTALRGFSAFLVGPGFPVIAALVLVLGFVFIVAFAYAPIPNQTPLPLDTSPSPTVVPTTPSRPTGDFRPAQASVEVDNAIRDATAKYNLPRWFYYAIVRRESNFNPQDRNTTDGSANTPWYGAGLTQLTGVHHKGILFPEDLRECNDSHGQWRDDMGLDSPSFGPWIDMCEVSELSDPFDPAQNLDRFSTVHAVPWLLLQKKLHPNEDNTTLLERVAYNWFHGIFNNDYPNDISYIALYREYINDYKTIVETQDGAWDGNPSLQPAL